MCAEHSRLYSMWERSGHYLAGRFCALIRRACKDGFNCGDELGVDKSCPPVQ
jgi:hypothetical protein